MTSIHRILNVCIGIFIFHGQTVMMAQSKTAACLITCGDQSRRLQAEVLDALPCKDTFYTITLDSNVVFQEMDGFGFSLTGGSAQLIMRLTPTKRKLFLEELFGCQRSGLCLGVVRVSMGASDLDSLVFTYHNVNTEDQDTLLRQFSLDRDTLFLIPLLKQILSIRPDLKIMASPWTAPLWMKSNRQSVGGRLLPEYYASYARYFTKYIEAMARQGIPIYAVTVQNEPEHGGNNPSMVMNASEQARFVGKFLGPAFAARKLDTRIIIWDHNCDHAEYPLTVLRDSFANPYIDGTAFHLYAGDIAALSQLHNAFADKNLYFTEQWTSGDGSFDEDLRWHMRNVIIGATRNWSKWVLEWNLASDAQWQPHTPGGCDKCRGAVTIEEDDIVRNVSYYIIAHAAIAAPVGSVRIGSSMSEHIPNVAFRRPDGRLGVILLNDQSANQTICLLHQDQQITVVCPARSVISVIW
jgi:glucosylceramidase